jgi:hypothetical protein
MRRQGMTFDEWWKQMKPAECDEVKPYFEEAWQIAFRDGYEKGVAAFHEAVEIEREECAKLAEGATAYTQFQTVEHYKIAAAIAAGIRMRSNAKVMGAKPIGEASRSTDGLAPEE